MIRKAIIVVLTLGAVSVTVMSVMSYGTPIRNEEFWLGDRDVVLFRCDAGHAKLIWLRVEQGGRSLHIGRLDSKTDTLLQINPNQLLILDGTERRYVPRVRWRTKLTTQPPTGRSGGFRKK